MDSSGRRPLVPGAGLGGRNTRSLKTAADKPAMLTLCLGPGTEIKRHVKGALNNGVKRRVRSKPPCFTRRPIVAESPLGLMHSALHMKCFQRGCAKWLRKPRSYLAQYWRIGYPITRLTVASNGWRTMPKQKLESGRVWLIRAAREAAYHRSPSLIDAEPMPVLQAADGGRGGD